MLSHWMIKLLNVVFVFSLGIVAFRLFYRSLISDKARRSSPAKRAELFLMVSKDGAPLLKFPLGESHYLIGRAPECDIPLKGSGIPLNVGELIVDEEGCFFKNHKTGSADINEELSPEGPIRILPGSQVRLYNYTLMIQNSAQ